MHGPRPSGSGCCVSGVRPDDLFNFIVEFVLDENTPDGPINVLPRHVAADPSSVPRGSTIFRALEEQLGLNSSRLVHRVNSS
jgi:hypothetical protein